MVPTRSVCTRVRSCTVALRLRMRCSSGMARSCSRIVVTWPFGISYTPFICQRQLSLHEHFYIAANYAQPRIHKDSLTTFAFGLAHSITDPYLLASFATRILRTLACAHHCSLLSYGSSVPIACDGY